MGCDGLPVTGPQSAGRSGWIGGRPGQPGTAPSSSSTMARTHSSSSSRDVASRRGAGAGPVRSSWARTRRGWPQGRSRAPPQHGLDGLRGSRLRGLTRVPSSQDLAARGLGQWRIGRPEEQRVEAFVGWVAERHQRRRVDARIRIARVRSKPAQIGLGRLGEQTARACRRRRGQPAIFIHTSEQPERLTARTFSEQGLGDALGGRPLASPIQCHRAPLTYQLEAAPAARVPAPAA